MDASDDILAVGDIHGRFDLLEKMLGDLLPSLGPDTRLVFLGDYIDRGRESAQVVDRLIELRAERPDTVFLLGNHERMLLNALDGVAELMFLENGGMATLASYGKGPKDMRQLPAEHLEFIRSCPLYFESASYIFVHAGVKPGVPLAEQSEHDLLWIRDEFFLGDHGLGKTVIFGHTPFRKPLRRPGLYGIDTGAVYDNQLTCLKLPEEKLFYF